MATTKVDIWNRALVRVGENDPVADENEDRPAGTILRGCYDDCLKELLEEFPWPWAGRTVTLATPSGVTRPGWSYVYVLPQGFVSARAIIVDGQRKPLVLADNRHPYEIQLNDAGTGLLFCCDVAPADMDGVEVTMLVTAVPLYPAKFVDALAWRLAMELATGLKRDATLASACAKAFQVSFDQAAAATMRGYQQDDPEPDSPSIAARS